MKPKKLLNRLTKTKRTWPWTNYALERFSPKILHHTQIVDSQFRLNIKYLSQTTCTLKTLHNAGSWKKICKSALAKRGKKENKIPWKSLRKKTRELKWITIYYLVSHWCSVRVCLMTKNKFIKNKCSVILYIKSTL